MHLLNKIHSQTRYFKTAKLASLKKQNKESSFQNSLSKLKSKKTFTIPKCSSFNSSSIQSVLETNPEIAQDTKAKLKGIEKDQEILGSFEMNRMNGKTGIMITIRPNVITIEIAMGILPNDQIKEDKTDFKGMITIMQMEMKEININPTDMKMVAITVAIKIQAEETC
jgi:hypothetical protein